MRSNESAAFCRVLVDERRPLSLRMTSSTCVDVAEYLLTVRSKLITVQYNTKIITALLHASTPCLFLMGVRALIRTESDDHNTIISAP